VHHRLIFVLGLVAACTACSPPQGQAVIPPASAATAAPAPAAGTADAPISKGPVYLSDLLRHRNFASAFAALLAADQLPDWPAQGGTSAPAQHVVVNGHPLWLVAACKPHDCPSERLLLLYDESTHAMSGVFARRKSGVANDVDSNDEANDELIWLGAPDEAAKQLLRGKLYSSE
jgi:hypothetical protein